MKVRALLATLVLALITVACGGSTTTPTSPTPAPPTPTTSLSVENISAAAERGASSGYTYRITFTLRETRGAAATVTGATLTLANGTTTVGSGTVPASDVATSTTVAGGGTVQSNRLTLNDTRADATLANRLTVVVNFSDSAGRAGSATAATDITAPPSATPTPNPTPTPQVVDLVGFITDSSTGRGIAGATVRISFGSDSGKSTTTNSDGYYVFPGVRAGTIQIGASASGYDSRNSSTYSLALPQGRLDLALTRTAPPAPAFEYRITGTTDLVDVTLANCTEGTTQQSDIRPPWSFTCSSARSGQFLYVSSQNQRSSGSVTVEIYKRGVLYKTSTSSGAYVIATASGSY